MGIKSILRKMYSGVGTFLRKAHAVRNVFPIVDQDSCYPELERKSRFERLRENRFWARRFGEVNQYYNVYGFDIKGLRNQDEYIDYYSFMESRNKLNRLDQFWSYVVLLRDKYLFFKFMRANGLPVPDVFAVSVNGVLHDENMNPMQWDVMKDEKDYFVKSIDGECASFVKHIKDYDDLRSNMDKINAQNVVFQRRIVQLPQMSVIYPDAINTIRVVTINKNGNPYVLSSVLRVGTKRTGNVDNWSAGGLAIGITEDGHLKEHALYKPGFGTRTDTHPDTGVVFKDFVIPGYREALELACKVHKSFYGIAAIGWDVAISDKGPVFIEGNDNFAINLHQACDRPLKKEWLEACR